MTTKRRVTKIAVKTDVKMPRPSVIAKPRTGPEPMTNRITAVINVVTLASKFNRAGGTFGCFKLFADTLENQHVGIHCHTDCQNDARDAR